MRLKHYSDNLKDSVVYEMVVQQVPLCRPVHVIWALFFQIEMIQVILCTLPHPFCNTSDVLCYNYHKDSGIARFFGA